MSRGRGAGQRAPAQLSRASCWLRDEEAFAGLLERQRLAAGLTQEALPERAGLGVSSLGFGG